MKTLLLFLTLTFVFTAQGFVKDPLYDDLEGAALVRALLKDGKLDLALLEIKTLQKNGSEEAAVLMGQWHYLKGEWKSALQEFGKIPKFSLYFQEALVWEGRSAHQAKQHKECVDFYSNVFQNKHAVENDALWKANCEKNLKHMTKAWATLSQAREAFPTFNVEREWITMMIQFKMNHEGLLTALQWLARHESPATHYLNMAEIFQSSGATESALVVLEMARAQHPINLDINLALSQIYFQKGLMLSAEEGFRRASINDGKYYYHTAELNRQTRRFERSLYFNASVVDEKERLKQKIATYVDANKYSLIASLDPVIQRSDLQKDDEIRYALAYSLVRTGDLEKPLKYLSQITKPELIEKTTVLRQTLLDCKEKKSACRL
jgi:tetratricopeptide (TPR) repeat protein